jgi:hypothetical protein
LRSQAAGFDEEDFITDPCDPGAQNTCGNTTVTAHSVEPPDAERRFHARARMTLTASFEKRGADAELRVL